MEKESTVNIEAPLENRQQLCRISVKDRIETIASIISLLTRSKK
jgi:hypothetical protein